MMQIVFSLDSLSLGWSIKYSAATIFYSISNFKLVEYSLEYLNVDSLKDCFKGKLVV